MLRCKNHCTNWTRVAKSLGSRPCTFWRWYAWRFWSCKTRSTEDWFKPMAWAMARVLVEGSLSTLSSTSSNAGVQRTGDEETHLLEGADKGEQTLCGEGDFCLETVPGTCREFFFHFRQPPRNTLSCRLTRDECRHPYLIDDYTVLSQHRIGQEKGIATYFYWTLNVNNYRKNQGWSRIVPNPSRFLKTCQQTNRSARNRITLMYARARNKNRLTKINGNFETTRQKT